MYQIRIRCIRRSDVG